MVVVVVVRHRFDTCLAGGVNWGIRFIHIVRRAVSRCRQRRTEPRQRRGPGGGREADVKEQEKGSERKVADLHRRNNEKSAS